MQLPPPPSSVQPVCAEDFGSRSSSVPRTRYRDLSSCPAAQTASSGRSGAEERRGSCWLSCPDSDEHTAARGRGSSADPKMRAAERQGTAEKLNGDMKRRASYPGELRAKHVNMSNKVWVKVAMAIAYFLCVSVAAFILVIYYVFFWTPDSHNNSTGTELPNRTECAPRIG